MPSPLFAFKSIVCVFADTVECFSLSSILGYVLVLLVLLEFFLNVGRNARCCCESRLGEKEWSEILGSGQNVTVFLGQSCLCPYAVVPYFSEPCGQTSFCGQFSPLQPAENTLFRVMSRSSTLALLAAAAIAAGATVIGYSQSVYNRRRSHLEKLVDSSAVDSAKQDHDDDDVDVDRPASFGRGFDEDLIQEFLARNYAFFGVESMSAIRKATVVVVGCGGVGSWAALMLLRRYLPVSSLILGDQIKLLLFFHQHHMRLFINARLPTFLQWSLTHSDD